MAPYTAKLTILYGSGSIAAMVTSVATPAADSTEPTRWVTLLNRSPMCIDHPHRAIAILSATPRFSALRNLRPEQNPRNPANRPGHFTVPEVHPACLPTFQLIRAQKRRRAQPRFRGLRPACAFQRILRYLRKTLLLSVERCRTQVADLLRRHRRTVVAPRHTNVRHDRS